MLYRYPIVYIIIYLYWLLYMIYLRHLTRSLENLHLSTAKYDFGDKNNTAVKQWNVYTNSITYMTGFCLVFAYLRNIINFTIVFIYRYYRYRINCRGNIEIKFVLVKTSIVK